MQKKALIEIIKEHLQGEITEIGSQSNPTEESRSELLALERALLMYRFLPIREFKGDDVIAPASLVEVEYSSRRLWILLVPQNGGLITHFEGQPVQVLTPQSPLGEAMLGKKPGDRFTVQTGSGQREYRVIQVL
ncbi:hypothetical protein EBZ37_06875 [bacterium]|nr:hypothetical protein [bacterium]